MWGRVIEIMLGLWLVLSPFLFGHYPGDRALWVSDVTCGFATVLLASVSFWWLPFLRFLGYSHLLILAVSGWLIAFGYISGGHPSAPGYQNDIFVGLTLLLIAIIPNEASLPPPAWRRHYQRQVEPSTPTGNTPAE
jgi:hypothetical protein